MLDTLIRLDVTLLNSLRSLVDPSSGLQVFLVRFGADLEVALVMLILVGLWLYGAYRKDEKFKEEALMIFYSIAFAFGVYVVLNLGLPERPRPESVSSIRPLVDHLPDNSFPSGHAIFFGASVLAAFFYTRKWIAGILLVTGAYMVLSRILAGVHYPGDILAGTIVGLIGAYLIYRIRKNITFTNCFVKVPISIAKWVKL